MELSEFEKPYFSKWVEKEEKIYRNTSKNFSEDEIKNAIEQFSTHQKLNAKLKIIVRHDMHPKFRAHLWMVVSGGASRYRNNPQCYHEDIRDLGKNFDLISFFYFPFILFHYSFISSFLGIASCGIICACFKVSFHCMMLYFQFTTYCLSF